MCSSQMKLHVGLILLQIAAGVAHGGSAADEAADTSQIILSRGSRHRLSAHRKTADFSTPNYPGGGTEDHRALSRLLARKQRKKKDKHGTDADRKKEMKKGRHEDKDSLYVKKMKQDRKRKKKDRKKLKKEAVAKATDKKTRSDNDCNCDNWAGDSWTDSWSGDTWSGDPWIGDRGLPIGWSEDGWDVNEHYYEVLKDLRADIVQLIQDTDRDLIPKCLRLAFHDCIDGCNGCIDPTALDNRGLEEPIIELLFPLVQKYQNKLSRSDVWAYCAIVSADMAVVDNRPNDLNFYMHYVGRKDCIGADEMGFGGPEVIMYDAHLTTHEMIDFFYDRFGFSPYEMVVLMGVHSAAVAHRKNLGFGNLGREDGWVVEADEYKLSNLYYTSMLRNVWELQKVENDGAVPDRYQWYFNEEDVGPIALTADMSFILNLEGYIVTDNNGVEGKVMCIAHPEAEYKVVGEEGDPPEEVVVPLCPMAKQTRDIVEELEKDNTQFLFAFVVVLNKMITNGYYSHELPMGSKSGKMSKKTSWGKSGKRGRHLIDEHSTNSRDEDDDDTEDYLPLEAVDSTETLHLKNEESDDGEKEQDVNTGKVVKSLDNAKPSSPMKKRCSCH